LLVYFSKELIMKVKSMTLATVLLAGLGVSSAFADTPVVDALDGKPLTEAAFTSTRTRAEVQDEAIKAIQDGTLAVNISKVPTVDGQLVGAAAAITSADVGSSSVSRAQVQEELMASRAKPSEMSDKVFDFL
jgi:hypothetical protein